MVNLEPVQQDVKKKTIARYCVSNVLRLITVLQIIIKWAYMIDKNICEGWLLRVWFIFIFAYSIKKMLTGIMMF
jgi:hypothetical protein